ncbi:pentatricopeptide repeat-containing protein At1g53600, mitochondrial-like [Selaginella moellendorffii]|uniref:pentatricopeptide repeat-containing protein At1g53600, mitochondrial-like n=1 Tax=Selaginella moellendorffii TaxID=88036 RepID=UPI000D1C622D|nr:pentatricopeptide repeat-containing protein At1g53600, mitochondrial-like [Selaginella moellendorffii]|eukprot:XP_024537827.1 pentatricopeptide repeat-containing protein At1g53600, mitochondrial-like [Selaginella moellendorffii]
MVGYPKFTIIGVPDRAAFGDPKSYQEHQEFDATPASRDKSEERQTPLNICHKQNGDVGGARRCFETMPARSSGSWRGLLWALARSGRGGEAMEMLSRMDQEGVDIQLAALAAAVSACKNLQQGIAIHEEIAAGGVECEAILATALINMFVKLRCLQRAKDLFERVRPSSAVAWTILIVANAQEGHLDLAQHLFRNMPERTLISWTSMITILARASQIHESWSYFQKLPSRSVVSWNAIIAAFTVTGHPCRALKCFGEMDLDGVEMDSITFVCAMYACSIVGELQICKILHAGLVDRKILIETAVANALVSMYAKCGEMAAAQSILAAMTSHNSHSGRAHNTLIAAFAQRGQIEEAQRVFDQMPTTAIDTVSWNALLAAYTRGGRTIEAARIFDAMAMIQCNTITWNTMISGFLDNDEPHAAIHALRRMDLEGFQADRVSLIAGVYAAAGIGSAAAGEELLGAGVLDLDRDSSAAAGAIHLYGRCCKLDRAREIFASIARRDALCWDAMVRSLAHARELGLALAALERMPYNDLYAWNAVVAAHAQAGLVRQAEELFAAMQYRNAVSWNTMIAGYAQNGHHCRALHLFRSMDLEGVPPTKISFISSIDSCGEVAVAAVGAAAGPLLHAEIAGKSFEWDVGVATAVISMYGKLGLLDRSLAVFHGMPRRTVVPYNATAAALAENGRSRDALHFLHTMLLDAVTPSDVSFLIAIAACSHAGLYEDGLERSAGMSQDHGLDPSFDHYLCVVDLLGRAGQLGDAEELLCVMPYEPDVVAWTALLAASVNHCDVHRAVRAAGRGSIYIVKDELSQQNSLTLLGAGRMLVQTVEFTLITQQKVSLSLTLGPGVNCKFRVFREFRVHVLSALLACRASLFATSMMCLMNFETTGQGVA